MNNPGQLNPLAALELTPAIVRILAERPERLLKVAEAHCRWMLAGIHPDRMGHGNEERARMFTEALADLKNPEKRAAAIESFLKEKDARLEANVTELRAARDRMRLAENRAAALSEEVQQAKELSARIEEKLKTSLSHWTRRAALNDNLTLYEENGSVKEVSLNGSLLLLNTVRSGFVHLMVIGENRTVVYSHEWPKERVAHLELLEKEHVQERLDLKLYGSYLGERYGPSSSIKLLRDRSPGEVDLGVFGTVVSPVLRVGHQVAVSDGRLDGYTALWIWGRLREVKRGVVKLIGEKSKRKPGKFTWHQNK